MSDLKEGDYVVLVKRPDPKIYRKTLTLPPSEQDYEDIKGKVGQVASIAFRHYGTYLDDNIEAIPVARVVYQLTEQTFLSLEVPDPDNCLSLTYATPLRFSEHLTKDQELDVIIDLYNAGALDAGFRDELIRVQQNPSIPVNQEQREALEHLTDRLLEAVTNLGNRNKRAQYGR
jgi:hypothetical protein